MLGKKRGIKAPQLKHKSTKSKLSDLNQRNKKEDDSIESNSDIDSVKSDEEEQPHNTKTEFTSKKIENTDEMRSRLAKQLISKLGKEDSDEEDKSDNEDDTNTRLLSKIANESSTKQKSYFQNDNFSPYESSFIKAHKGSITSLDISKDNTFVITASKDTRGILIDLETNKKTLLPQFTTKALNCVTLSPNSKTAYFGGKDKCIYHIDLVSNTVIQKIKAHNEAVTGILVDNVKEQFYSIGNDHLLKVWSSDTEQSVQLETFYGHTSKVNTISVVPSDITRIITSGMDNYINLWKVDSQSFLQFKYNDVNPIDCLCGINSDIFFSGDFNGKINAWRTTKKRPIGELSYAHGYQKEFKAKHWFFTNYNDGNKDNGVDVIVGNPILSMGCVKYSDLLYSGSNKGSVNFYKVTNEEKISIEKTIEITLKNGGCVNAMKESSNGEFIVCGNGCDGKNGRWDWDYDTKMGISIIKLFK